MLSNFILFYNENLSNISYRISLVDIVERSKMIGAVAPAFESGIDNENSNSCQFWFCVIGAYNDLKEAINNSEERSKMRASKITLEYKMEFEGSTRPRYGSYVFKIALTGGIESKHEV